MTAFHTLNDGFLKDPSLRSGRLSTTRGFRQLNDWPVPSPRPGGMDGQSQDEARPAGTGLRR